MDRPVDLKFLILMVQRLESMSSALRWNLSPPLPRSSFLGKGPDGLEGTAVMRSERHRIRLSHTKGAVKKIIIFSQLFFYLPCHTGSSLIFFFLSKVVALSMLMA